MPFMINILVRARGYFSWCNSSVAFRLVRAVCSLHNVSERVNMMTLSDKIWLWWCPSIALRRWPWLFWNCYSSMCPDMTGQTDEGSEIPPTCQAHVFQFFCCSAGCPRLTYCTCSFTLRKSYTLSFKHSLLSSVRGCVIKNQLSYE